MTKELIDLLVDQIKKNYLFAVIRAKDEVDAIKISEAAILGGIKNIEVTYTTPDASKAIQVLNQKYQNDETVIIGAGTVVSLELAKQALQAGAKFLVSPDFSKDIMDLALANGIEYFPGCMTPTEITTAAKAGAKIIKVFPGGIVGPSFIKDLHGPLPDINLMPSGGVDLNNLKDWQKVNACAVGIGSSLTAEVATKGYESVTAKAKAFVKKLEE